MESRQTSLDTAISSSSIPQGYDVDSKVSRTAKLGETNALVSKTARVKTVRRLVKRKTRKAQGHGKFIILRLLSMHLIILQTVYQRVKIATQIVTARARARATVTASLMMGQHRRNEKQTIPNRLRKVRAHSLA